MAVVTPNVFKMLLTVTLGFFVQLVSLAASGWAAGRGAAVEEPRVIQRQGSVFAQLGRLVLRVSKVCEVLDQGRECLALEDMIRSRILLFPKPVNRQTVMEMGREPLVSLQLCSCVLQFNGRADRDVGL